MATRKTRPVEIVPTEVAARAATLAGTVAETQARRGFALAPAYDLLYAAGLPHLVWLTEETPREDPVEVTLKSFWHNRDLAWPRTIAHRAARLYGAKVRWAMGGNGNGIPSDESRELAASEAPFTEDEAKRIVREVFVSKGSLFGVPPLFLFEALLGAELVVKVCVEAMSFLLPGDLNQWDSLRCQTVNQLPFVLRRVSPALARDAHTQLEAMFKTGASRWPYGDFEHSSQGASGYLTAQLDLMLHGAKGAMRSGHKIQEQLAPWSRLFTDDRSVHSQPLEKPGPWAHADGHLVWLGGDVPLEWQLSQWKKFTGAGEHARLVENLGPMRDSRIKPWLEVMAKESKAKKLAALWLERHALASTSG